MMLRKLWRETSAVAILRCEAIPLRFVRSFSEQPLPSEIEQSSSNGPQELEIDSNNIVIGDRAVKTAPLPADFVPESSSSTKSPQIGTRPEIASFPKIIRHDLSSKPSIDPVSLLDAIRQLKVGKKAKFDETVEAHIMLGIDPRRSDQVVRGAASIPHGTGKVVRVAVFADGKSAEEAIAAGADVVGAEDLVAKVKESGGKLDFDKCIATPSLMPKLGQIARILGPRGLMPNPKVGTVTTAVAEAVKSAKMGRVDFRADKSGIVHAGLGKLSFAEQKLEENVAAFVAALLAARPVGLKKSSKSSGYLNKVSLSSTMGAGVRVTVRSAAIAAEDYLRKRSNSQI